ncbi:MAG: hypothetical protein RBT68_11515 [Spirochaetia bacterium]|jgi:hypothetical protein|nr:hypothetical protein [Spirochaetia bacterium]
MNALALVLALVMTLGVTERVSAQEIPAATPDHDAPAGDNPAGDDPFGEDLFGDDAFGNDLFGEDLFGDTDALVSQAQETEVDSAAELLTQDRVKLGGELMLDVQATTEPETWETGNAPEVDPAVDLEMDLYVDARPDETLRIYAKGSLTYPFAEASDYKIKEAFADIEPVQGTYVRAGLQTLNWGVGYFFSPANLLDLGRIDPEDPEARLPGRLAVRAQVPVRLDNYYAYALLDEAAEDGPVGMAGKLELLLGSVELGLGGLWQPDAPQAAMATLTGRLGDFDLFGEASLRWNEDKVFVVADDLQPSGISTETREDTIFGLGTVGFTWTWMDDLGRLDVALRGQYYYNGLGYDDQKLISDNPEAIMPLVSTGVLGTEDLMERGRHYGAASLGLSDIGGSNAGARIFWLGNLAEGSGKVSLGPSYEGLENLKISLEYNLFYGPAGSEFTGAGQTSSIDLKLSLTELTF